MRNQVSSRGRLFAIAPHLPVVETLVGAIAHGHVLPDFRPAGDPLAWADLTLILPTRRAVRAVSEALLALSPHRAAVMPQMLALGEVGRTDPAAMRSISREARQFILSGLVRQWAVVREKAGLTTSVPDEAGCLALAGELAGLLDRFSIEGVAPERLRDIVPGELAAHWQDNLTFLEIVISAWPEILRERNVLDPVAARVAATHALARQIAEGQDGAPVIIAGSTGSMPATRELMRAVMSAPRGAVILPLPENAGMEEITNMRREADPRLMPSHPLGSIAAACIATGGMCQPLVAPRPAENRAGAKRCALGLAVMSPWRQAAAHDWTEAAENLALLEAASPGEEALATALVLREAVEEGRRAVLITRDRELARRVAALMARWQIEADDSSGVPLSLTPPGTLTMLVAEIALTGATPHEWMALVRHQLVAGAATDTAIWDRIEETHLRSHDFPESPAALLERLRMAEDTEGEKVAAALLDALAPLASLAGRPLCAAAELLQAHAGAMQLLCQAGPETDAIHNLLTGLAGDAAEAEKLRPGAYPAWLGVLLAARTGRSGAESDTRIAIWGPLEARMQPADLVILGGLNEGSWPELTDTGPFLSRAMTKALGLPEPEQLLGLSAHDFLCAMGMAQVFLSRTARAGGAETVPSRWLQGIEALAGADFMGKIRASGAKWLDLAIRLSSPDKVEPDRPSSPVPPAAARPGRLSVTAIGQLVTSPYGVYASEILRLRDMEKLAPSPDDRTRGTAVHRALQLYMQDRRSHDAAALPAILREELARATGGRVPPLWLMRLERAMHAMIRAMPDFPAHMLLESKGEIRLDLGGGREFTISAKADRIDIAANGAVTIHDYKTGAPKSRKDLLKNFASGDMVQLPLEALIMKEGGFGAGTGPLAGVGLLFLGGTGQPFTQVSFSAEDVDVAGVKGNLAALLMHYIFADNPWPAMGGSDRFAAGWKHLARLGAGPEEEDGEE